MQAPRIYPRPTKSESPGENPEDLCHSQMALGGTLGPHRFSETLGKSTAARARAKRFYDRTFALSPHIFALDTWMDKYG